MDQMNELFGSAVFEDSVQKVRLPDGIYKQLRKTKEEGTPLTREVADVVANAMKDWAVENGVTHFTHWFQPMTGVTAEKHDSFIQPDGIDSVIMEFSGKELIKGEPDASSFPSGGLRSTFEARGYTAWDPTSNAFIKDGILCIPTVFCSYTGEALDKKTPLMRSMEALSNSAVRVLHLIGETDVNRVITTVGPEQEYFLIERKVALKRKDITYTGRTLFGTPAPKGQELDDHYFGVVKRRVSEYMKDLDEELWKLGILAKTKHNEVAPAQHELAPIFTQANIATDHNQLTMEIMKKVAERHGMKCLLYEKPFEGINGSGKHNNWSISTDKGENLLKPGKTPHDNPRFLLFLSAVIAAVDEYQDLLRSSVATAGNDHRLGANEAPPAIISVFIGDDLKEVLDSIEEDSDFENRCNEVMNSGIDAVPDFAKDTTDRNRTSPFAFTGNKFEFRMPGSALSISGPNFIINTAVAEILDQFAVRLEKSSNPKCEIYNIVRDTMKEHKRIIFNGNNYSDEWVAEAERRGLCNLKSTPEALPAFVTEKSIDLFVKHGILTRDEMLSRYEINLENYSKAINIEAKTMLEMARRDISPAVAKYVKELSDTVVSKRQMGGSVSCVFEEKMIRLLSELELRLFETVEALDSSVQEALAMEEGLEQAVFYNEKVLKDMAEVREVADQMEIYTPEEYWPFPTYGDLLFSIQE